MSMQAIPVTVVTGFLGAGKTTLIRQWLATRPVHEPWAVLVNEFGALGIDAALLAAPAVFDVAGGCACCAAQAGTRAALTRLLRAGPWHRLLIELSGLGHPGPLIDLLRQPPFDRHLQLEHIVALVDARRPAPFAAHRLHELARAQIEAADCVVINRAAGLPAGELSALVQRLAALPPFGRSVIVAGDSEAAGDANRMTGVDWPLPVQDAQPAGLPAPAATMVPGAPEGSPDAAPAPLTRRSFVPLLGAWRLQQQGTGLQSVGWRWPASVQFDRRRLQTALAGDWLGGAPALRAKGVFRTEREWYGWQLDDTDEIGNVDSSTWQATAYRRDNRVEILLECDESGIAPEWLSAVEATLRSALSEPPAAVHGD